MDKVSQAIMANAQNHMCVPQVGHDPFRFRDETFAQSYRDYIEYILSDDSQTDPLDITSIY